MTQEPAPDANQPAIEVIPQNENAEQGSNSGEEGTTDDTSMGDMDMSMGTDVGMEMPIADSDVSVPPDAVVFDITGENFAFNPSEMRVKEGDTVVVRFRSTDGFHDWVVDEFDARTARVNTGGTTQVTFVADKKGTFEYYCSVGNHRERGMVGTLIVE